MRFAASRRHARYSYSAVGDGDRLCGRRPTITRRTAGRLDIPRTFVIGPVCYLHSCALLHQPEARARTAARGASQRPRTIAPSEQYGRVDSANHPRARYHLRRYRDSGGGGRNRHLRRIIRLRPAPSPELARHSRSSDCDAEGDGHGDVDFLRRDHVRRLLHSERGAALRFGIHSRYRPAALWHSDADDGDPFCARHVPGLGRHSAAERADFPAHNEEPSVGRPVWYSRSKARRCGTVVWRNLHGQHADGFPIAALRLFPFLSKERVATADQHGYDLPRFRQFYDFAMDRRWTLHHFPSDHLVAAEYHLRGTLSDQRGASRTKSFC